MKKYFKKEFGQNFLTNHEVTIWFIDAAQVEREDIFVEVGPGDGMITQYLIPNIKKLIAIEIDKRFVKNLKVSFSDWIEKGKLSVINKDILNVDLSRLKVEKGSYKVIGSLPYNISKQIIQKFLEAEMCPKSITVIIQKEVALDYAATTPRATFLSNYASIYSEVEFLRTIPKEFFKPTPKVDGAIILFNLEKDKSIDDKKHFTKFLKSAFLNKRKKLINNLNSIYKKDKEEIKQVFKKIELKENARASEVSFQQWKSIYFKFAERK